MQVYVRAMAPEQIRGYPKENFCRSPVSMKAGPQELVIAVVDDAAELCEAVASLLRSAGFRACSFACAEDFLSSESARDAGCLILDVQLPGMSGLQLQQHLSKLGWKIPIVFITALEDRNGELQIQAMRAGAIACLHKPFGDQDLLTAVQSVFPK